MWPFFDFSSFKLCYVWQVDFAAQSVYNSLTEQQKKFARCAEQIQKVGEISATLNRIHQTIEQTVPLMQRLNSVLPTNEQLEPFSFADDKWSVDLTLRPPILLRFYSLPYWSDPLLIFDIRALWHSDLSAGAPECQKLKIVGQTSMALNPSNSSKLEQLALKGLKYTSVKTLMSKNESGDGRSELEEQYVRKTIEQLAVEGRWNWWKTQQTGNVELAILELPFCVFHPRWCYSLHSLSAVIICFLCLHRY